MILIQHHDVPLLSSAKGLGVSQSSQFKVSRNVDEIQDPAALASITSKKTTIPGEASPEAMPTSTTSTILNGNIKPEKTRESTAMTPPDPPKLRFDWTNLELHSSLAKKMYAHQHNCSLPVRVTEFRISPRYKLNYGLGSDCHVHGVRILKAMSLAPEKQERARSQLAKKPWAWMSMDDCNETQSSLSCYFANVEPQCPNETVLPAVKNSPWSRSVIFTPDGIDTAYARAASTEFMFSSVTPLVQKEAERQLHMIFPTGTVPKGLICVHVRWGDKEQEMQLVKIQAYVRAVRRILKNRQEIPNSHNAHAVASEHTREAINDEEVHILLCTEDPSAVEAFRSNIPGNWIIHMDPFYTLYEPYRASKNSTYSVFSEISVALRGKPGLWALASALVAMEANDFVLTTKSNWSRILNELRKNIVDPRCNNCTTMIDLFQGES